MSARTRVAEWFWPRDGRTPAEIEAEVREELESHIERMAEELVRGGVQRDEARRQAAEKFGDVEQHAAQCRRIALGDRLIVRRTLALACVALLATTAYLVSRVWEGERQARDLRRQLAAAQAEQAVNEEAGVEPVDQVAVWVERIADLRDHMHTAFAVGAELTLLDPDLGVQIVEQAWPKIEIQEVKTGLLKAFAFSKALAPLKHPRLLQVLHLGMTDEDAEIRRYAASYLEEYAREDLSDDPERYLAWFRKYGSSPPENVLRQTELEPPASLLSLLAEMEAKICQGDVDGAAEVARGLGKTRHPYAIPWLIGVIEADNSYDTVYGVGYFALGEITDVRYSPYHDGAWWRRWWEENKSQYPQTIQELPIPEFPKTPHGAAHEPFPADLDTLLGKLRYFAEGHVTEKSDIWQWASEVAEHQEPAAIPFLIGVIDADNTQDTIYGVGYYGLSKLTGVRYDASHDGAWWRAWWEDNKSSYPQVMSNAEIPDRSRFQVQRSREDQADDIADVAHKAYRVKGNNKWLYAEIESAERQPEPADGYKLLLVLPGGDGSRDFMPFVKRIYKHALTPDHPDYVVVQLVAPKWARSEQVVWPTAADGPAAAKLATEKFIAAAVEDVASRRKIDRGHVFALGWSSGGPAVYAAALEEEPIITGAFAAMSVFHPEELELSRAKGRPFFILHSPEDDVCPLRLAVEARDTLTAEGASVEFLEYEGGHGWRGNVYGNISAGVRWLEEQTAE